MRLCYKKDIPGIMEWVDKISMLGREKKKAFLTYALDLIRQNFLLNQVPEYEDRFIRLPQDENLFVKNFSPFIREHNINQFSQLINKAISDIEANAYPKTVFLDSSIQVMGLIGK
jgi:DNA polymerase-3 subunit delta'